MSLAFSHTVKPNQKNERPQHCLFLDVESRLNAIAYNKVKFVPFLWTAIYRRYRKDGKSNQYREHYGTDPLEFWKLIEQYSYSRSKLYVVSHHLEVDFMPLGGFKALYANGWSLDNLISHGRVVTLYCHKEGKSLIIMNNGNLFDGSIEEWGKELGLPKLKMPSAKDSLENWLEYCMRDTKIVALMWDNLLAFMDKHDLGNFKLTRASLALNAYRHRFMSKPIAIHAHPEALALERSGYHGGRFEALQIGDHPETLYYQLDINSMYGYIETACQLPYELRGYKNKLTLRGLERLLTKYSVIAEIEINSPEPFFPIKEGIHVNYPTGSHLVTFCTPELIYALKKGYIKKIHRCSWYRQDFIFRDYARYFLNLKETYQKENNKPMRALAKFFPNALYGKFGQYGYKDTVIGECPLSEFKVVQSMSADTGKRSTLIYYGGKIHMTTRIDTSWYTFVAISAHITAFARMMLYNLMVKAGFQNVYHVATDSLIVNQQGYDALHDEIDPHISGKLKLEKTFKQLSIKGINDMVTDGLEKIKGIPKKAVKLSDDTYLITEWVRLTTLLQENITDYYYTRDLVKTLARPDYKEYLSEILSTQT